MAAQIHLAALSKTHAAGIKYAAVQKTVEAVPRTAVSKGLSAATGNAT